jgi:hypothetical protein
MIRQTRYAQHPAKIWIVPVAVAAMLLYYAPAAVAGCGCEKPAPRPAAVRPDVTWSGMPVSFFASALVAGESYRVTFTAMDGTSASVTGSAEVARDLADAVEKPQLRVALPSLPLGPASIVVSSLATSATVLTIAAGTFTVAPQPIAMPSEYGTWTYPQSQLAVDGDGVVYLSLDLTGMRQPLVFEAEMVGYPLRYTARDVVFMNTQGFLMQLLVQPQSGEAIPGMFVYPSTSATTSDALHYSRHEFRTYFLDHYERTVHSVDASGNWHADGTRHVDHDHLVVALIGRMADGSLPVPGATPEFTLRIRAHSLFHNGLTGSSAVSLGPLAVTTSFDSRKGLLGAAGLRGDVHTNGQLKMSTAAVVGGNASAASFSMGLGAVVLGKRSSASTTETYMAATAPKDLVNLGDVSLTTLLGRRTIAGPGSFRADRITVTNGSTLFIDNSAGPVTIYVADSVKVSGAGGITVADPDPEKFALYVSGTGGASFSVVGNFYGVVYAPSSTVTLAGGGLFTGAFLGKTVNVNDASVIRYDESLLGR